MSKSRILAALVLSALILSLAVVAGAQEKSAEPTAKLKLKSIKMPSELERPYAIQVFIPLSTKKGIAFLRDSDVDNMYFKSMMLFRTGKATAADVIPDDFENTAVMTAAWIENGEAPGAAAASSGTGLLFYGHDNDDENKTKVSMIGFDSAGKFSGQPTDMIEVTPPAGTDEIQLYSLNCAKGAQSIGVAVCMNTYTKSSGASSAIGRFFEMDFSGSLIGSVREIPFDAEKDQSARIHKPIWSGQRWLLPARVVEYEPTNRSVCKMISVESLAATAPVHPTDFEIEEIYDTGSMSKRISEVGFLPEYEAAASVSPTPPKKRLFNLFIQNKSGIPEYTKALSTPIYENLVQQIKDTGAKVRKPKRMKAKQWSRAGVAVEDMKIDEYNEIYSNFLATGADSYLVLRMDHVYRRSEVSAPSGKYLDEGRMCLLSISRKFKKIEEVLSVNFKGEQYPSYWPLLREKDGKYWIIMQTRDPEASKTLFYVGTVTM